MVASWKKKTVTNLDSILKSRDITLPTKVHLGSYGFSSSHVWMWELDHEESWVQKNWCFWTVGLEKPLESPLDCKEIHPAHPKGDQSWVFIGRTDAKAETPILWLPDAKSWFTGKDPDTGKDWGQEEKGTTEDEMGGWHHQLNGHGFGYTLGVGDGQGALVCCGSWGRKESDLTEQLNWTELWCWRRFLRVPWTARSSNLVSPKGNQSWIFIGKTDAEAPVLWPPDVRNRFIGKDANAGKDWRQEKGMTEKEMAGWHHLLDGHEFEQAPGVGDGQGSLVCCSPWGRRAGHAERLNWQGHMEPLLSHTGLSSHQVQVASQ